MGLALVDWLSDQISLAMNTEHEIDGFAVRTSCEDYVSTENRDDPSNFVEAISSVNTLNSLPASESRW